MVFDKFAYKKIFNKMFSKPVTITFWDGDTVTYGEGAPVATIKFNEMIPMTSMMKNPTLTLGEAYMDGIVDIDGSLQEVIVSAYQSKDSFFNGSKFAKFVPKQKHTKEASQEDVQSHYDIGNDFYEKWLDPTMTYSCAYFKTEDDTLEEAQYNKVRHILNKLHAKRGESLLDIGCGWGTLIITAAKEYGLKSRGVTLSQEQYDFVSKRIVEEGLENQVEVYLRDYRDVTQTYDHITSVGMFEHVGKENLSEYFQNVSDRLNPNGTALIHGITGQHIGAGVDPWINKYIFPGGYIPHLAELVEIVMDLPLQFDDIEPLRRHYQKTLEIWTDNFHAVKADVIDSMGERFYRMWDMYLQACAASFESGNIDVIQFLMSKGPSMHDMPMTRAYIYEADNAK
ncbi:SAM-dependent methyltransferase [Lactococcus insecticola]|uniref:Cyclopropane-fatty-acyl-phospholipid synthase n=1 Tax=Pseudolactococcus insecticola TaxID=2709158 RepID=A0A6A0B7T9_9LACT|nr:cyclopropane-fatty-acyl-phospholipid synthase family protein [Lactococcus insecticola]GFH40723.1 cyclopropane-fatty-acyl-phospholipid synthase [Lactococcus insecticola]